MYAIIYRLFIDLSISPLMMTIVSRTPFTPGIPGLKWNTQSKYEVDFEGDCDICSSNNVMIQV